MFETYNRLPRFLKNYCAVQCYERYTAQDQAVWRYALRQLHDFLSRYAVPVYHEGLHKTGISIEKIPRIEDMDKALAEFGWGAAAVEGFIPPIIFLEFQARRVLPIAVDIRRFAHLSYTPAPDIIHEAAGHAPIIADPEYAEYLTRYAELAQKAIFSDHDIRFYEAIRYLSDIKEMRGVSPQTVEAAQVQLDRVAAENVEVSEASKVARLYWWTAEYGLVGSLSSPRLYGAGLLSSVMESKACLGAQVRKIPLSKEAVETSYDITEPQPQLFVARDFADLHHTLSEVEKDMSYMIGGIEGLRRAKNSGMVNSCQLDSGLQLSGRLTSFVKSGDSVSYLRLRGRCQFSFAHQQLPTQGCERHKDGCRVPLGRFASMSTKPPWLLDNSELRQIGVQVGHRIALALTGGHVVEGVVLSWYRQDGHLLYITWGDFRLKRGERVIYASGEEEFDMPIGSAVVSVFGGPAAREEFGSYSIGKASSCPHNFAEFSPRERELFDLYAAVRELREHDTKTELQVLAAHAERILSTFPEQWLLALELCDEAERRGIDSSLSWLGKLRDIACPPAEAAPAA